MRRQKYRWARKSPSAAFIRDKSRRNVRHGKYSARVVLKPGDHASYTCKAEAVFAIKDLGEGEGSESWWGWSWKLPRGWRGTDPWGMLFEFTTFAPYWPSYGMLNFDASTTDSLELRLHTGLTPNPGSGSYNSAYEKKTTLFGPGAPRPMVYGKWLDFYMHVVWHSRHERGARDLVPGRRPDDVHQALLGRPRRRGADSGAAAPDPALQHRVRRPGENGQPGLRLEGGFYRANTPWTNEYWWDGMRRRQSEASMLAGFPNAPVLRAS
jgi:polysaccharide lyase-like protein